MGSTNGLLLVCMLLLLQSVVFVQSNCDTEQGSGNCQGSEITISHVKTFSTSEKSKNGNSTTTFGYVRKTGSGGEGRSYSYEAHHSHTTSSSSSYSHHSSSKSKKTVRVIVTGSPPSLPKENTVGDAVASQNAVSIDETFHVVEAADFNGLEAEAPGSSYAEPLESSSNPNDALDETAAETPIDCSQESISEFFSIEPVVFVEHVSSPSPSAEPVAVVEVPIEFYPCGYPKPVNAEQHDSNPVHSDTLSQTYPCPLSHTEPEPVPLPPEKPESSPVPVTEPVASLSPPPPPQPFPVIEKTDENTSDSNVLTKRVRNLIETGNITGLAEIVIESDDIYGLNMGFRFSDDEREEALEKTEQRSDDKDVIVLKALAQAALSPEAKGKVVQLMVVTATAPDGYNFSQHRSLVNRFEEIFSDSELLHEVIAGNPQTYSKRRLYCSGCTPVNSYICAYCWPSQICGEYFWCPESTSSSHPSLKKSETDKNQEDTEIEESAAVSEPAPRSHSIEGDIERAAITDSDAKSSSSRKTTSKKDSKRKSKSTKGRGKQRNRRRGHHRTGGSPSPKKGSNKDAHRDQ